MVFLQSGGVGFAFHPDFPAIRLDFGGLILVWICFSSNFDVCRLPQPQVMALFIAFLIFITLIIMKKQTYLEPDILVYPLQPGEVLCQSPSEPVTAASIEDWVEDETFTW